MSSMPILDVVVQYRCRAFTPYRDTNYNLDIEEENAQLIPKYLIRFQYLILRMSEMMLALYLISFKFSILLITCKSYLWLPKVLFNIR